MTAASLNERRIHIIQGEFFVNYNLVAAGALLAAIPPIIIFIALQKHFVAGLTLGSTKG